MTTHNRHMFELTNLAMGVRPSTQLRDQVDELELTSLELKRSAMRAKASSEKEILEIKKLRNAADVNGERIDPELVNLYATNAIRFRQESTRLMRFSSRMRGFAIKMRSQADTVDAVEKVRKITKVTSKLISGNKLDLTNIVATMEQFDGVMNELELVGDAVTTQLDGVDQTTVDTEEVKKFLDHLNEIDARKLSLSIPVAPSAASAVPEEEREGGEPTDSVQKALEERYKSVFTP